MNSNLHELVFIMDQSIEIKDKLEEAVNEFKHFVSAQKKFPINANLTVDIFGSEYQTVFDNVPLEKVKFTKDPFPVSGECPLIDSAVKAIDDVGIRLNATWENDRPSKVIVTIVTFGRDNASKKHTYEELAEIIKHQTEVYKWTFFLMTDFSINMEKLGIPEDNTIIIKKKENDAFKKAYAELNEKLTSLRTPAEETK